MKKNHPPQILWTNPIYFVACGFGFGAAPYAPGTFGTLIAIPFYFLLRHLDPMSYLVVTVIGFALGVWLCDVTAKAFNTHDHPAIVWDEIIGYWFTMWLAPHLWYWWVAGFILFRIFDAWKPWPIKTADRYIHGGFGIMFDDFLAAIYAWLILQLLIRYFG